DPGVVDVNVSVDDILIAGAGRDSGTLSWTGVTERYDVNGDATFGLSGGDHQATSAETPRSVEGDFSSAGTHRGTVSAVWR
ncbi:MAG: hypothetical protein ACTSU0_10425, partial [Alphaproteobacteria bacterium]